jgi:hypothetical protein
VLTAQGEIITARKMRTPRRSAAQPGRSQPRVKKIPGSISFPFNY